MRILSKQLNRLLGGFTLIELIITIGIIGLMMAILLPAMRTFDRKNRLAAGGEDLKSAITQVRNYALAPRSEDSGVDRYSVVITNTNINVDPVPYEIVAWQAKPDGTPGLEKRVIARRTLPYGVVINGGVNGVCPGDGGSSWEVGFTVPEATAKFDNSFTYSSRGTGCDAWQSDGVGIIQLKDKSETSCPTYNDPKGDQECRIISIHGYNGQVMIE